MAKSKIENMTATQQQDVLSCLKQGAAAWLLSLNGRSLRDRTDLPRNSDGTYNARELYSAVESISAVPHLDVNDLEKVLLIADKLYNGSADGPSAVGIYDALVELERKHGPGVFITFVRELLAEWRDLVEFDREEFSPPSREEIRTRIEQEVAEEEQYLSRNNLKICVICDNCGKLRRGRRWVKATPPRGFVTSPGLCPDCDR